MIFFPDESARTLVMGIINITPDSFYSSSRVPDVSSAVKRAEQMLSVGADILDVGAESTRPGSTGTSPQYELDFLIPTVEALHREFPGVPISVDTRKAKVAREAIYAGAAVVNDVSGLRLEEEAPEMLAVLKESSVYYVLMHSKGTPETMNVDPTYEDFWDELTLFFKDKLAMLEYAGVSKERVIFDPGIGFGKRNKHNLSILANLPTLKAFGQPLLIGASRKGFIGRMLDDAPPEERLESTLAISALCAWQGVEIVRVHDVKENKRAVLTIEAIKDVQLL